MEKVDKNKDGKMDLQEFLDEMDKRLKESEKREEEQQLEADQYWENLERQSQFTDEEYKAFRDQHVLEIRKLIAEGRLPENYTYSDVPQLTGNFINSTHVQKNGVL